MPPDRGRPGSGPPAKSGTPGQMSARARAVPQADLRLLVDEDARHLRIDLRAFGVGQASAGRCGKVGAVARLLELCQVPVAPELTDRCDKGDGDGALMPIDAGDARSRSSRNLAALPFLEGLDLLRLPPAPALCLQLLRGSVAHGAIVGRRGIVLPNRRGTCHSAIVHVPGGGRYRAGFLAVPGAVPGPPA